MNYLNELGLKKSNYDKNPSVTIPTTTTVAWQNWDSIARQLADEIQKLPANAIIAIDTYTGVNETEIIQNLRDKLPPHTLLDTRYAFLAEPEIEKLTAPFNGGDDPIFGYLTNLELPQFLDPQKTETLRRKLTTSLPKAPHPGSAGFQPADAPAPIDSPWHSRGYLPHFDQPGRVQLLTFRLHDSLPKEVLARWKEQLGGDSPLPANDPRAVELRKRIRDYEDAGHGACHLGNPSAAKIIQETLLHFDGERYDLLEWCIMPNHVHVLISTRDGHPVADIVHSWKSFSANKINTLLGLSDALWMPEYHDRFIRDEKHLADTRTYIRENPVKAGLVKNADDWQWSSAGELRERGLPARNPNVPAQTLRAGSPRSREITIVIGPAAQLIAPEANLLIYADMPRWEGQLRQRRGETTNLGLGNKGLKASLQYKRAFFIDWRVLDRHKRRTIDAWHYYLDTTVANEPRLLAAEALREGLRQAAARPIRLVPFFDPGPWGGQWMRQVCDLPDGPPNYAWCFDCVPEENSLKLTFHNITVETPSINLVHYQPRQLLGEAVNGLFGAWFPIRFDFLDTMQGGNLSYQVHPDIDYSQQNFNLRCTQDESYYLLDSRPDGLVYLGCKDGADPDELIADLQAAQDGKKLFDHEKFAGVFPAKKHDHFLIPSGTLHCSASNTMVLEISATPYIFTFKLWDWNRLGLDGKPRPINLERGKKVIRWERDQTWCEKNLVNQFVPIDSGDGWTEEKTGLYRSEYIETRRHWFTKKTQHKRTGSVEVINLVEGEAAIVESPTDAFAPFEVHYAETFILPDAAGDYTIRPKIEGAKCATLKAFVRINP